MILRQAFVEANQRLNAAGIAGAPRDARALLAAATGLTPDRVLLEGDMELRDENRFEEMVTRRISGEPVSKSSVVVSFGARVYNHARYA